MSTDYKLLAQYDRRIPKQITGRKRTMAFYDDSNQRKMLRERNSRYYTTSKEHRQWHVASLDIVNCTDNDVHLVFPLDISKQQIANTLQFLCEKTPRVGGEGLPSILDWTSETKLRQNDDGRYCLQVSRREYAIITAALLPMYLEPSYKNVKRKEGYKNVAWHPIFMRYAMKKTNDTALNKWRRWALIRSLAGLVNSTVSGHPTLDYEGGIHPIDSSAFVVYKMLPRVLNTIFKYFKFNTAAFIQSIDTLTIVHDVMAAFLMPRRLEYIHYQLVEEVLNAADMNEDFCARYSMLVVEVRKLHAWVRLLDEHSRTRIKIDLDDARCTVNFRVLHATMFIAACDPSLNPLVSMAMMCSMSVDKRRNESLYAFLERIPTPCQYNKRVNDLYNRLIIGVPAIYHEEIAQNLRKQIATTTIYDDALGLNAPPPVYKKARFPTRKMVADYATPTFDSYKALVKEQRQALIAERPARDQPLQAMYLYFNSFDRNLAVPAFKELDAWDLLSNGTLECTRLLPLTNEGHYLDRSFFYI